MDTTVNTVGGLRRSIEITLSFDELTPHFERAYSEMQKNLQLEGFRKGKVPIEIIKQRYGDQIERDALSDIAGDAFRSAAQEQSLDVIGTPVLVEMNRTADRGARFVIEFDVMPQIELRPYEDIEIVKPVRDITDADVEEELYNLQLRSARLEPADQITDSMYVVKLKFAPVDPETNAPLLGGKEQEFFLDDERMDPLLRSELINLRVGDTFVYRTEHEADEQPHAHVYHVTVQQVQRVVLPELDEQFISSLTGGRLRIEEDLRQDIRQSLQEHWEKEIDSYLRERLVDAMVEMHDFQVPESLVRSMAEEFVSDTLERNKDDKRLANIPREQLVEHFLPQAEQTVRWQLLADIILRTENLTISPEQLEQLAARYGVDVAQLQLAIQQNPSLRNRLLTDTLFDFLFGRVRIVERPYDELMSELGSEG
ncbi:MAG: trigger factor [Chlorobi bacterium]|nr:trigger factor [Chlorobiota bacterium]